MKPGPDIRFFSLLPALLLPAILLTALYLTAIFLTALFWVQPSAAHTGIATTVPDHDAVINQAPTLLRFVFPGQVTITNARIRPVDSNLMPIADTIVLRLPRNRIGQSTAFGQEIELDIPLLDAGMYQVVFQVTSIEGHVLADDFTFTITGKQDLLE